MSLEETEAVKPWPRAIRWPALFLLNGLGWWLICWATGLLTGCSSPPKGLLEQARPVTIEEALQPPLWSRLRAAVVDAEPVHGNVRLLPVKSACRPRDGAPLPYLIPQVQPPRVGQEWRCLLLTSAMAPEPDVDLWLIVATHPPGEGLPAELSPIGMPGCQLAINPEMLVHVPRGWPNEPSLPLSRESGRGRVMLRWTPPAGSAGMAVWLQVLVSLPTLPAGLVLSHGIEVIVGT